MRGENLPSRADVVRKTSGIPSPAFLTDVAVFGAGRHAQRYDSTVSRGRYFVPSAVRQRSVAPGNRDRGDGRSRSSVRKHGFPSHQLHGHEIGSSAGLSSVIINEQGVRFGRRENDGNIVRRNVERRKRHVGQLVETEGGFLAMAAVPGLGAAASITRLEGNA